LVILVCSVPLLTWGNHLQASDVFPQRPIRLVVPFTPGGPSDTIARLLANGMTERMKQQAVVDNRPGGGSVIATEIVAKAEPNGHVLLLASATHAINPALRAKLPYDSINGFIPISMLAEAPGILVAHPSLGVRNLKELIAAAKAKPSAILYASSGTGSGGHINMELLKSYTKIDVVHVPYKGANPALNDLLAGRVQLFFTSPANVTSHIRSGKLRAIGSTSPSRSPVLPDVPTLAEEGVPGYDSRAWYALLAPAGTPAAVIRILNEHTTAIMRSESTTKRLFDQGLQTTSSSPEETAAFIKAALAKWTKVLREANIRPD